MKTQEYIETLPKGACRSRGEGLYSVMARTPLGDVSAEQLDTINAVVKEFGLPGVRVTARQRIQLIGIPEDKLRTVIERLGLVGEGRKYFVQACAGNSSCRFGVRDSMEMGARLEEFLNGFDLPAKLKSGVSGCPMSCGESYVRDIGLAGTPKGWTVLFGGNAGRRVRKGDVLAKGVSDEEALKIVGNALDFYAKNAKKKERTARFVERVGIDAVLEAVNGA
ncbi:nitrite reductase [Pseudodesulfovibrio cashew]|uniref:Nitrite reductase n=1 Tax=Pseudodesulfovibrio cashew TaxID=2678688 RepID=A0A6I6JJC6_9BACT|nr:nitrite reductase [Pseudodesulfovibrio cashew]QGY41239.1 nitrite reductase [Pseudodesulfovibrio cashew]